MKLNSPIRLKDHPAVCYVTGFERRRNAGPVLTMAIGYWVRDGFATQTRTRDIVTKMKLSDMLSHLHDLPINADKLYGPAGRIESVGRKSVATE